MQRQVIHTLLAIATLVGTIIGVGMFSVPYSLSRVGVAAGVLLFFVLTFVQVCTHLFYAEVAMATKEKLRLPGLAEKYLGRSARGVAGVVAVCQGWGSSIAYILVGGAFLYNVVGGVLPVSVLQMQLLFGCGVALALWFGLTWITRLEFWGTFALVAALLAVIGGALPAVLPGNLMMPMHPDFFLAYGVILFALSGLPAILEMEDIMKGKVRYFRLAIIAGTIFAAVLTAAFGFIIWGATGTEVSQDAISGLVPVVGQWIILAGAVLGFLAVITSHFTTGIVMQEMFEYDYKWSKRSAWFAAAVVPLMFAMVVNSVVTITSITGALFSGASVVLVCLLYRAVVQKRALGKQALGIPVWVAMLIALAIVGGAVGTLLR